MSESSGHPHLATESIAGQRPYQEDAVLTETLPDGRILVAVADGMGGHAAGEVASGLALESLKEGIEEGGSLLDAFKLANARVREKAREPGKQGMGTTLVVMLLDGDEFEIANVGDSRGYLVSAEGLEQITKDHSFVAEAVDRGQSEEEAKASRWKDALTRSIGADEELKVDVFGPLPVKPDTAVLLCSDGLYKALTDAELAGIYTRSGSPRGAAQSLVTAALEGGSDDNISVALAEFGEVPRKAPAGTMEFEWTPAEEEEVEDEATGPGDEMEGEASSEAYEAEVDDVHQPRGPTPGAVLAISAAVIAVMIGLWLILG